MKIACSKYTNLDEQVILKASSLRLPLTGGTALELWANYYKRPDVRKRSDNDIDIVRLRDFEARQFQEWVQKEIDPDKVKVDFVYPMPSKQKADKYVSTLDGIYVMSLPYIAWSKITRTDRSAKDAGDLRWIFSISDISDDEFVKAFEDLGLTEKEIEFLNTVLA